MIAYYVTLAALGLSPVSILPITNLASLAQVISEVVPRLATCWAIKLTVLLEGVDACGEFGLLELLDGFVSGSYFV